jgi:hypothetical protein
MPDEMPDWVEGHEAREKSGNGSHNPDGLDGLQPGHTQSHGSVAA